MVTITVNGVRREIQAPKDTALLYVLRNESGTHGTAVRLRTLAMRILFGTAGRQGNPFVRNAFVGGGRQGSHHAGGSPGPVGASKKACPRPKLRRRLHPVQQAWIEEQTPLCGFCQNGMMIKATELLERVAHTDRRGNQRGVHDFGPVGASVPLRKLHRDH